MASAGWALDPLRGRALVLVGQQRTNLRGSSAGDAAQGVVVLEKARALLTKATERQPENGEAWRSLASASVLLGDAFRRMDGKAEDGRRAYEDAVSQGRTALKLDARDETTRRTLAVALVACGDAAKESGDLARARALFEESLAERRALLAGDPSSAAKRRDLTIGLGRAGDLALEAGDLGAAEKHYREALTIREALLTESPSMRTRRDVAVAAARLGQLLRQSSPPDTGRARAMLERQVEIIKELAAADPSDKRLAVDLVRAMNDLAELEIAIGEVGAARGRLTENIKAGERAAAADAKNPQPKWELARAHELHASAQPDDAKATESSLRAALELYQGLAASDPSRPQFSDAAQRVRGKLPP